MSFFCPFLLKRKSLYHYGYQINITFSKQISSLQNHNDFSAIYIFSQNIYSQTLFFVVMPNSGKVDK